MKRLIVFILLIVLFCGINLSFTKNLDLASLFPDAEVEVYVPNEENLGGFDSIKNGDGLILFVDIKDLNYIQKQTHINGFTLKIAGSCVKDVVSILNPQYCREENCGIYGYKKDIPYSIFLKGEQTNFQCVSLGNEVLLGFPILLGSY